MGVTASLGISVRVTGREAMEMQIPAGTTLCPVILNTDETVMKFGGRAAQKPIYITVGNLPYASRKKD